MPFKENMLCHAKEYCRAKKANNNVIPECGNRESRVEDVACDIMLNKNFLI
jgi:hypothetical protein